MNVADILTYGRHELKDFSETSGLDVEILVKTVLNLSTVDLIVKSKIEVLDQKIIQIKALIQRRKKQEPVAYLINQKEFFGLDFYVDQNVLIPRPDTENLLESVILEVESQKKGVLIIDVGTGSGCIPVALAQSLFSCDFIAMDVSREALSVARQNIEKFHLKDRIKLQQSDLLSDLDLTEDERKRGIMITANLPYIPEGDSLMKDVHAFEPHLALYSGEDGLNHYRKLLEQAIKIQPCAIFLEIDPRQVEELTKVSQKLLSEYRIEVKNDLAGKERVFCLLKS